MIPKFTHSVIRTPSDAVNVIGVGGINQSTMVEIWGSNGSGKSAFAYDSASMFLQDNPDGIVLILDPELSTDIIRLEQVFKMDMERVILRGPQNLEEGFAEIYKVIGALNDQKTCTLTVKKFINEFDYKTMETLFVDLPYDIDYKCTLPRTKIDKNFIQNAAAVLAFHGKIKPERITPVLIIWDTISSSKPKVEVDAALKNVRDSKENTKEDDKDPKADNKEGKVVNVGGMTLKPRLMDQHLSIISSTMWQKPITIFFLNQIRTTGFKDWRGPHNEGSGGNAFKHFCHYRIGIEKIKPLFNKELMMNVGTLSRVDIEKSKFGPRVSGIKIFIDDMGGGRIVPKDEAAILCHDLKILNSTGGAWYEFVDEPDISYTWDRNKLSEKSGRWITDNNEVRLKCIDKLAKHFRLNYYTLDYAYEQAGWTQGKLTEEEKKKRDELISKYSFAPVLGSNTEKPNA
jgi:RecA/RadA recombinase